MAEQGLQVVVKFPKEIPADVQGAALMHMEMELRTKTTKDIRVVKDVMGDDSKLRLMMTPAQRDKL